MTEKKSNESLDSVDSVLDSLFGEGQDGLFHKNKKDSPHAGSARDPEAQFLQEIFKDIQPPTQSQVDHLPAKSDPSRVTREQIKRVSLTNHTPKTQTTDEPIQLETSQQDRSLFSQPELDGVLVYSFSDDDEAQPKTLPSQTSQKGPRQTIKGNPADSSQFRSTLFVTGDDIQKEVEKKRDTPPPQPPQKQDIHPKQDPNRSTFEVKMSELSKALTTPTFDGELNTFLESEIDELTRKVTASSEQLQAVKESTMPKDGVSQTAPLPDASSSDSLSDEMRKLTQLSAQETPAPTQQQTPAPQSPPPSSISQPAVPPTEQLHLPEGSGPHATHGHSHVGSHPQIPQPQESSLHPGTPSQMQMPMYSTSQPFLPQQNVSQSQLPQATGSQPFLPQNALPQTGQHPASGPYPNVYQTGMHQVPNVYQTGMHQVPQIYQTGMHQVPFQQTQTGVFRIVQQDGSHATVTGVHTFPPGWQGGQAPPPQDQWVSRGPLLLAFFGFFLLILTALIWMGWYYEPWGEYRRGGYTNPFSSKRVGSIRISSVPRGAQIYLDDVGTGRRTPATLRLAPGNYTLELRAKGHKRRVKRVELKPKQEVFLDFSLLKENVTPKQRPQTEGKKATLFVTSRPNNAQVWLDGRKLDISTPAVLKIAPGPHIIKLTRRYHQDKFLELKIKSAQQRHIQLNLKRIRYRRRRSRRRRRRRTKKRRVRILPPRVRLKPLRR
ncbi:MAG: hypothetical protein CL920_24355 [Deltaproteobacteria bacterium]|nr:hypothetical protein [Deltaproteobacteria bacterium]MBU51835.1 hypothetical protein [Deltaproteobacteria bacterium]|tara:strand:+ start:282 stop:2435 length:2154 start_codon:yes stop_codon:yes gene_type:complete